MGGDTNISLSHCQQISVQMAHHQKHHTDCTGKTSAMQSLLKMFNLSNTPTVPLGDDELSAEADEPPDDQVSPLTPVATGDTIYTDPWRLAISAGSHC